MHESEDNMSAEDVVKGVGSPLTVKIKPKKRSIVERELETSLTARVTSPVTYGEGVSTSRYGRARRLKTESENPEKINTSDIKSPLTEKSPVTSQSPVYKMHASNSSLRAESPMKIPTQISMETQIESIYQENISLSRFSTEDLTNQSPAKKFPKVYIRKDLIQKREAEETVVLIKNMFSPAKSGQKKANSHLNNILERSSERYNLSSGKPQNGYLDNSSVVKTLDFDSKRKKKENKDSQNLSKSELFDLEARCPYQVGDLAWARMGTYPFWPSIVTRDPTHGVFVKRKLFGRIERDVIHVTFFGDNGRRGWIVDNMLRKYMGQLEFETTRENFTSEDKKKDPRLYAAHFVSEKKQALWNTSVEEAEMLLREPKRLRIDIFNDMLEKSRGSRPRPSKSSKISRTDSDVSLSESLYDSLFSEEDGKTDNTDRSRNMSRNKSLDVSDVVTACLDNMAAKSGITKIQKQSHMDRWLQKAKSKTPEKNQVVIKVEKEKGSSKKNKKTPCKEVRIQSSYSLRRSNYESHLLPFQNEHDYSKKTQYTDDSEDTDIQSVEPVDGIGIISKVESLSDKSQNDSQEIGTEGSTTDLDDLKGSTDAHNTCDTIESTEDCVDGRKVTDSIASTEAPYVTIDITRDAKKVSIELPNDITIESKHIDISMESPLPELQSNNVNLGDKNKETNCDTRKDEDITNKYVTNVEINVDPESQNGETTQDLSACNKIIDEKEDSEERIKKCKEISEKNDESVLEVYRDDAKTKMEQSTTGTSNLEEQKVYRDDTTNEIEKKTHTPINNLEEKNMSNDYDSDSDAPLPYSPLSVDLNKEKSGLEELYDQMTDQDWNKPEKPNEKFYDNFKADLSEPCLNNNLNSIEEYKNMISDFDSHGRDICDNYDTKVTTGKYISELTENQNHVHKQRDTRRKTHKVEDVNNSTLLEQENNKISTTKYLEDQLKTKRNDTCLANKTRHDHDQEPTDKGQEISNESYHIDSKESNIMKVETVSIYNNINKEINSNKQNTNDYPVTEKIVLNGVVANDKQKELNTIQEKHHKFISESIKENGFHEKDIYNNDYDIETASIHSEDSKGSSKSESRKKLRSKDKRQENPLDNPEFVKYLELRQDAIMDENPELSQKEIVAYLHKTWLYEENLKTDTKKNDDLLHQNLVKGLNTGPPRTVWKKTLSVRLNKLNFSPSMESKDVSKDETKISVSDNNNVNKDPPLKSKADGPIEKILDNIKEDKDANLNIIKENDIDSVSTTSCDSTVVKYENVDPKDKMDVMSLDSGDFDDEKHIGPTKLDELKNEIIQKKDANYRDYDGDSIDSEDSEAPLIRCKLRSMKSNTKDNKEISVDKVKKEIEADVVSINSEDSEVSISRRKKKKSDERALDDPEFIKYVELRQDALMDENPQLTNQEITTYLYQTWLYEENSKSDLKKSDEKEQSGLVKGLNYNVQQPKKIRRNKIKTEKDTVDDDVISKEKPRRRILKACYNEEYSDIEDEIEYFEIFKAKHKVIRPKIETDKGEDDKTIEGNNQGQVAEVTEEEIIEVYDEVELYFEDLTKPKPNIFKGLFREKVCEICEKTVNLVKCKSCNGMFHMDCVNKITEVVEVQMPTRGRKKKKKAGRKPKSLDDSENHDDGSDQNASVEEIIDTESHTVDADALEAELTVKMKEIIESSQPQYDSYSSDDGLDWTDTVPGKCEIIDIKLKPRHSQIDYSDFKCKDCQNYDTPVCFVCKNAVSKTESAVRQKCHVAHCNKYYHLECLDHWPQTQFNGGEPSRNKKKYNEYFEAITCPRHVCHTCVSDDPRGCKTRFSGDKLAKCVRCPATYHSFTKCLPAGTKILTASHIICPRHYEHRPGKIPCHVNTGWCFICALGGSLICCEYCPTSFHAECLNIKPPEGGYMCEDCETGRLPLYGEMVWVKLGHYRWWPGIVLHPAEIPENILAVKHSHGEFVVRFFGQYDHYWVNRGRVFPFQEGDSGRISSQKSKIDAAFTTAMEHAQRACEILKTAQPNEEESLDIASSLLPPHYVKLKVNKPCGSLCGRRLEDPESSLTQCECNPLDEDPCGPYSQCLNRMLLTECGPTCRAADRCNNRAFEKRLYPKLVPYRTPSRGWGLKTLDDIKAGQFVIEYVGELLDEEEFRRRMARMHEMRDENYYFLTLDKERMIDAGPKGNLARFMNHCCEPNCETQKWTVLGDVRVGLFALYDIPANNEVTFNYNLECAGIDKKRCMCGAKRCSGYIGAKPKQDDQSKKNKLPGKRIYKKRKTTEESPSTSKNKAKRPIGRPPKPRELTEIEKDLLIIKNATNGLSSDESCRSLSSDFDRDPKALKRKRVNFSTEEVILYNGSESPSVKKPKLDSENCVGD